MKSLRWLVAVVFVVFLVACTTGQQKELAGTWQKEDGKATVEFSKDGKMKMAGEPAVVKAGYKVKDKETLLVDLGVFGTATLKYALAKDTLTLTDAKGGAHKYTRVKETRDAKKEQPKAQAEQAKAEQAKAEQAKAEQAKAEQAKAEQVKAEQAKAEKSKAEQAKAEKSKAEQVKAEKAKAEQAKAEKAKAEQAKAEQAKAEQAKTK
jgi:type IV secretory pathway VirB10-like protein